MSERTTTASSRILKSGLAASLGVLAASQVAVEEAGSVPAPSAQDTPHANLGHAPVAASSYESCTPYFGLTKRSGNLVKYTVNDVNNSVTPVPVVGTDLIPVVTLSDGAHTVTCAPTEAWTSEADWSANYLQGGTGEGGYTYPGLGYFQSPALNQTFTLTATLPGSRTGSFTPTSASISFVSNLTGVTVSSSAGPENVEDGYYNPFSPIPPANNTVVNAVITRLQSVATVSTDATTWARTFLTTGAIGACDITIPADAAAMTNLNTATVVLAPLWTGVADCTSELDVLVPWIWFSTMFAQKVAQAGVTVSVEATTSPTTTPTTSPSLPKTGSNDRGLLFGALSTLGVGAMLLALTRRRRSRRFG